MCVPPVVGLQKGCPGHPPQQDPETREVLEGGRGSIWGPKVCVPKMARQDFPNGKFRFFPRWSLWSGGGGGSRGDPPPPRPTVHGLPARDQTPLPTPPLSRPHAYANGEQERCCLTVNVQKSLKHSRTNPPPPPMCSKNAQNSMGNSHAPKKNRNIEPRLTPSRCWETFPGAPVPPPQLNPYTVPTSLYGTNPQLTSPLGGSISALGIYF